MMNASTSDLVGALRFLAREIKSHDETANATLLEAANRLEELSKPAWANLEVTKTKKVDAECICHRCIEEHDIRSPICPEMRLNSAQMILCKHCGNKRCPHATDHRLKCTNSNEPGQPGSKF